MHMTVKAPISELLKPSFSQEFGVAEAGDETLTSSIGFS